MTTPKPKLDLFTDSVRLVSKKCRTSTPTLKPPKAPNKSSKRKTNYYNLNRINKEFEIICKLGSGYFAEVFKAKSLLDGQLYAIKRTSLPFSSNSDRQRKLQEVNNFQSLPPHPNIVRYYDSWEEDGYVYIQTELCRTSLNELLEKGDDHKLSEHTVWCYLLDLLAAIKHLHDNDLIHMDIKPDNIFISYEGSAKLGDFGLMCNCSDLNSSSMMIDTSLNFTTTSANSTPPEQNHDDSGIINRSDESIDSLDEGDSKYLASETMQGKFTKAADIFSLGITIFEVASGLEMPQKGEIYHKLRHNEIDDLYFNGLSADLVSVIKMMMEEDYTKRPTIDDLLRLEAVKSKISSNSSLPNSLHTM